MEKNIEISTHSCAKPYLFTLRDHSIPHQAGPCDPDLFPLQLGPTLHQLCHNQHPQYLEIFPFGALRPPILQMVPPKPGDPKLGLSSHSNSSCCCCTLGHVLSSLQTGLWHMFQDLLNHLLSWKTSGTFSLHPSDAPYHSRHLCMTLTCLLGRASYPRAWISGASINLLPETTFNIQNWVQSFQYLL